MRLSPVPGRGGGLTSARLLTDWAEAATAEAGTVRGQSADMRSEARAMSIDRGRARLRGATQENMTRYIITARGQRPDLTHILQSSELTPSQQTFVKKHQSSKM